MVTSLNQVNDDNGFEATEAEKISNTSQPSSSASVVNGATATSTSSTTPNPLGNLSSYTYGLSLYMVNYDIFNKFITGGGTMAGITGATDGVRVVAQSGGLAESDNPLTTSTGERVEYYMEDLTFTTHLPGGVQKASANTDLKFKIIEPRGFSFIQDLTAAGIKLNKDSNVNAPKMIGAQQHFIISIKFNGYDVNGAPVTQMPVGIKGNPDTSPLMERYFAIRITSIKFKLDGKMITYQCDATITSQSVGTGQMNGLLKSTTTLNGTTVWDVLANPGNNNSLVSILNAAAETDKDSGKVKIPTKYSIEFLDDGADTGKNSVIGNAKLVNDVTFDNTLATTPALTSAEKSTIAGQFKAVSIDGSKVSIQQARGQNILTIIDNIITKSEYISAALNEMTNADAESKSNVQSTKILKWYSVNPVVSVAGFDEKTNNWAYEIKFQIRQFEVPYVRTTNATRVSTYPGASKKYEYWLTGKNSEIISYEQQYDGLFFVMSLAGARYSSEQSEQNTGSAPVSVQTTSGGDTSGSKNKQFQYNSSMAAQLYSPGDQSIAKIKIMGDPDYIMSTTGVNYNPALGGNKVSIDPLNGQIFIEISFLMATDYGAEGLMNVSGNIQFYNDDIIKDLKIDGVVYKINHIENVFSKGLFTQTLICDLVDQQVLSRDNKSGSGTTTSAGSGNQRSEADAEIARLESKYPPPVNNQSDAETARLSRLNSTLIRPGATNPSQFDTRRADIVLVTSTFGGAQPINPKTLLPLAPSKNNGQPSKGITSVNDDQVKITPTQIPDNRPRGGQ